MATIDIMTRIRRLYRPRQVLDGWCSEEKAAAYTEEILDIAAKHPGKPITSVEIGVMSAASLIPIAMATESVGGRTHGIDAWDREAALEGMLHEDNLKFWGEMDYVNKKQMAMFAVIAHKVEKTCGLIHSRSVEAAQRFFKDGSVHFLHIDGNHSPKPVMDDVIAWMPKMAPAASIIMNATGWTEGRKGQSGIFTIQPAALYLIEHGWETDNATGDYLVLRKS